MAKTDQYDRMNTDQLKEQATQRGFDLEEFQALKNNEERAQRLRDHDAQRDADAQVAAQNAEQARQNAEQQQGQAGDQATGSDSVQVQRSSDQPAAANTEPLRPAGEGDTPVYEQPGRQATQPDGPYDTAPYPTDESRQAAQDAAAGNLSTRQAINPDQVPPVGGQAGETPAEQDHTS